MVYMLICVCVNVLVEVSASIVLVRGGTSQLAGRGTSTMVSMKGL